MSKLEISLEYASLRLPGHCPLGVWVIPSPDDIHRSWTDSIATGLGLWQHKKQNQQPFIFVRYYAGGIFKFTMDFSPNYPFDRKTPQINFQTDCFHPLIDQANQGLFNLSLKFPTWHPHENFICNLLYYLKSCFKRSGLESIIASGDDSIAFNKHAFSLILQDLTLLWVAYRLYRDQTDVFATLAAQSSTLSSSPTSLYDQSSTSSLQQTLSTSAQSEDPRRLGSKDHGDAKSSPAAKSKHLIKFDPLDDEQFKQLRQKIFLEF
ncbi:hypothetical protein VP01_224g3 [Puccinia sorghi]|uniref:UBC core domain-containing protein n=1 Tax=Puccinia sorghi TaxID=27349 RepID=A0A0L6VAC8_9BASI|nr:hypothetical protein VP01_224g3 [Puccinia sorghi]